MRLGLSFALRIIMIIFAFEASARASTFYIDFSAGSDGNDGLTKTTAWKRHPYMAGYSGNYSHVAGDRFIFKGGVTWNRTNFAMTIAQGGTPTVFDYYGVDKTWFNGVTWTRPVFDGELQMLARGASIIEIFGQHNITIDNLEVKRHMAFTNWGVGNIKLSCAQNVLLTNLWVHDWALSTSVANDDTHGGIIGTYSGCSSAGTWIDHSEISNAERSNSGRQNGGATRAINVRYSKIHDVSAAMLYGYAHDTEIYNVGEGGNFTFDKSFHSNVMYIDEWSGENINATSPAYVYNNYIHDVNSGSGAIYPNPCSAGNAIYVFNNVVKNTKWNGAILVDTYNYGSTATCGQVYIYNNTLQVNADSPWQSSIRVTGGTDRPTLSVLDMRNNHSINENNLYGGGPVATLTNTNNINQTNAVANSQGYNSSQTYVFSPTLNSNATVGTGANLTSLCNGTLVSLCKDTSYGGIRNSVMRPTSGAWYIGAYNTIANVVVPLLPPTNLRILNF